MSVSLAARPAYFSVLQREILALRARTGRPHWLALDEAHHLLPVWGLAGLPSLAPELNETIMVTVNPAHVAPEVLKRIDVLIATGKEAQSTVDSFCRAIGETAPDQPSADLALGDALVWFRHAGKAPVLIQTISPRVQPRRHQRKYAQGIIDSGRGFVFRPLNGRPELRALNLMSFAELAGQVDDDVWLYHLHRGDFARWFRDVVKDEELAAEAERGAALAHAAVAESRALIVQAIERWYTLPE